MTAVRETVRGKWRPVGIEFFLLLQCGMITLAVLKHPGGHYLLSLAATLPVVPLVIVKLSDFNGRFRRQLGNALIIFPSSVSVRLLFCQLKNRHAELLEARAVEAEINRAITERRDRSNKRANYSSCGQTRPIRIAPPFAWRFFHSRRVCDKINALSSQALLH